MTFSEHITPQHLALKALIYIRQSTQHQVMSNQESLQLQLALKQRALQLGWASANLEIVDADLGLTGTSAEQRKGFQYLLAQVALGVVGIIFSYDVTRLSRNCSDWYPLLDICSYKRTLIGDREGIYDPRTPNGRLILGLKGQFAEIELNTIRARMQEGLLNKAKRGDLIIRVPTGYVLSREGVVTKDPNLEVQNCIRSVFDLFFKLRSASKVLKFFYENNIKIPRFANKELIWKNPNIAAIHSILKNPTYAGANVYGKTQATIKDFKEKKKEQKRLPMEEWKHVVKDKFPSYITWEQFEEIQKILKDNYAEYDRNQTRGIPRSGQALLHGIMYCSVCGHKMVVRYKKETRYVCNALSQRHGGPSCQYLNADYIDAQVVEAFFQALAPAELNTYDKIVENQWHQASTINKMKEQQLERLRYQVKLAERQFNQVDPDNRLVASELERRWEIALKELKNAEMECQEEATKKNYFVKLPDELRELFLNIGAKLPEVWKDLSHDKKKSFLRCLIDKVAASRKESHSVEVRIVWQGGDTTTKEIVVPVKSIKQLPFATELEEKIVTLSRAGKKDKEIARQLTKDGYYSANRNILLPTTVQTIRLQQGVLRRKSSPRSPVVEGFLTIAQLAEKLNVTTHWIYDKILNGKIKTSKHHSRGTKGLYVFPDTEETVKMCLVLKNEKS